MYFWLVGEIVSPSFTGWSKAFMSLMLWRMLEILGDHANSELIHSQQVVDGHLAVVESSVLLVVSIVSIEEQNVTLRLWLWFSNIQRIRFSTTSCIGCRWTTDWWSGWFCCWCSNYRQISKSNKNENGGIGKYLINRLRDHFGSFIVDAEQGSVCIEQQIDLVLWNLKNNSYGLDYTSHNSISLSLILSSNSWIYGPNKRVEARSYLLIFNR